MTQSTALIELHELPPADKADQEPHRFSIRADCIQHVIDMEAELSGAVDLSKLSVSPSRFALVGIIGDPRPLKIKETYDEVMELLSLAGADLVTAPTKLAPVGD